MNVPRLLVSSAFAVALLAAGPAGAQDQTFALTIKDHKFEPTEIEIPANTKVKLQVTNADSTPEEFDSPQLHREKVIPGGKDATIIIGPLKPGRYEFMGEYHSKTARGAVVVK
jgi:plastocyanin